ncbi:MAG: response regulator [Chloroflexota bacterium]
MRSILLAEDNEMWRKTLKKMLYYIDKSYQVKSVESLGQALEEFSRANYDLLITDLRLRGTEPDDKGGLILIRAIKQLNPLLPTILVTLYPDDAIIRTAYKDLGVDYFLNKVELDLPKFKKAVNNSLEKVSNKKIRKVIYHYFSGEELEIILFDFDLSRDTLDIAPGDAKNAMIMSMIRYFEQHGRLHELIKKLHESRPNINWFSES